MAKKQSNISENSAAAQSTKPGIFIPIPTAEITNAAETARIRAEREAKEKADKKAADAVVALIRAIGVVEYTDACLEKINAAKQAYIQLTPDQKLLVENADVITTSEKEYDKLKIAAEKEAKERAAKEAKEKADKKAADAVVVLISAIGTVEYTDACLKKIEAAKQAYNQLTQEQKSLVENGDVFKASVIKYKELEVAAAKAEEARKKAEKEAEIARIRAEREAKEKADKKAADAVVALIRAIGVVEYTDACLEKINAAKQAYTKLTADQKKLVENADVLTASEDKYNDFQKAEETARKKAEEEVKRKAIEAARKKAEEETRKKAEAEAKKKRKKVLLTIVLIILLIGFLVSIFFRSSETEFLEETSPERQEIVEEHNECEEKTEKGFTRKKEVAEIQETKNKKQHENIKRINEVEKEKITNYERKILNARSVDELLNIYNAIQKEDINADSAQDLLGLTGEVLYLCYREGVGGVTQSKESAIKWLEKSADYGNPDAMEIIGDAYLYQLGYYSSECSLNPRKAYDWLGKAVKLNPNKEDLKKAYNKAQKIVSEMNKYGNSQMSWKIECRGSYPCNDQYFILNVLVKKKYYDAELIDEKLQKYVTVEKEYEYEKEVLAEKLYYQSSSSGEVIFY